MQEEWMIGFDVGGTKTDAVLFNAQGEVLRRVVQPGANPLDVGFDAACARYMSAIDALRQGSQARLAAVYGAVACVDYFGDRVQRFLQEHVDARVVRVEPDGACLISAMRGHVDGASLICGTGSSLCFRWKGSYGHIGGWGYLVDSCASGFILGKQALLASARAMDGRGERTLLYELVEKQCGGDIRAHFETIYRGGRPYIASFAHLVFEARRAGDAVAAAIFDQGVRELSELVWTAYRRFDGGFPLVLNGGIFQHFPEYAAALKTHIPPQVQAIDSDAPPVYGCAVEAMYDAGFSCDAAFKARFLSGYEKG